MVYTHHAFLFQAVRRMLTAFKQSSLNGHLSEAKYKEYIDTMLTLGLSREAASISELGTGAYPSSLPLWIARLSSCSEKVGQLCRQALDQVDKQVYYIDLDRHTYHSCV